MTLFPGNIAPLPPAVSGDPELARAIAVLRAALAPGTGEDDHRPQPRPRPVRAAQGMPGPDGRTEMPRPTPAAPRDRVRGRAGEETDPRDPLARRILSIHLPRFAIERWRIATERRGDPVPDDLPVALAAEGPHGPVIHAASRAAEQAGIRRGIRVVDARALLPGLRLDHADPGADRAALHRLMLWSRRWCPWSATDGTDGLLLDTTGSDHLRGGEAALLAEIEGRLAGLGLTARTAIAPTPGAAWALARFGGATPRAICTPADLAARMAPLPVQALRLTGDTVLLLQRLGLATVGATAAVPRISLARRFSRAPLPENPLLRLDQMFGRLAEPLDSPDDPPRFAVELSLAEPILDPVPHLPALAAGLCDRLARAGFGARRIALTLYRSDGEVTGAEVATSAASRDARHLVRLFDGRLDRLDPGFGFDLMVLSATVVERLPDGQPRLEGRGDAGTGLAALVDRLAARFGPRTLNRPRPQGSHIPERAEARLPAMTAPPATATGQDAPCGPDPAPERPLRLLDPPEEVSVIYAVPEGPPVQFIWRRVTHRITRFGGPERIAPEWWQDRPGTRLRDYYRIEDHRGRRFWLYRDGILGDGRGAPPRWFLHGIFA
jgi:protein ImuB